MFTEGCMEGILNRLVGHRLREPRNY